MKEEKRLKKAIQAPVYSEGGVACGGIRKYVRPGYVFLSGRYAGYGAVPRGKQTHLLGVEE